MARIEQLRYVRLGTRDLTRAADFAQRILGLQLVAQTDQAAYFRSDFRDHTLVFVLGDPAEQAVGFEIHGEEAFSTVVEKLRSDGVSVTFGDLVACRERKVRQMASFRDGAGNDIELVVRPENSGWRFHATRDCGVLGLSGVALRAKSVADCERLWTGTLGGRVTDWAGGASFVAIDDAHHRLAYYPSAGSGILSIEYEVENVDLLMQNSYFLQSAQIKLVHGPGRRPTSGQLFLTFIGPDEVLYSFVAEGNKLPPAHRARQFAAAPTSYCAWGSPCAIPEMAER